MIRRLMPALICAAFTHTAVGQAVAPGDPGRGELLYETHCIACHDAEVHWRDQRLATDWASLRGEVSRWQEIASLGWNDADIDEVTRYVNTRYYDYPESQ